MVKIFAGTVVVLLGALISVAIALLWGVVFMICWNIAAPAYWSGAPALTLVQAIATTVLIQTVLGAARTVGGALK